MEGAEPENEADSPLSAIKARLALMGQLPILPEGLGAPPDQPSQVNPGADPTGPRGIGPGSHAAMPPDAQGGGPPGAESAGTGANAPASTKPKMRPNAFSFRFIRDNEWRVLTGYPGTLKLNYDFFIFNEGPGIIVVTLNGIHKHTVQPGKTEHFLFESTTTVSLILHPASTSMRANGLYELVLQK